MKTWSQLTAALLAVGLCTANFFAFPAIVNAQENKPLIDAKAARTPPVSESVQKTIELKKSLSPEQSQALQSILNKYQSRLQELQQKMSPAAPDRPQAATANVTALYDETRTLQTQIDSEIEAVLSASQQELFQYRPQLKPRSAATQSLQPPKTDATGSQTEAYTDSCYYSAYYATYTQYYSYQAYINAYYNYVLYTTNQYAYDAYNQSYNAYYYSTFTLRYAAGLYFEEGIFGTDTPRNAPEAVTSYTNANYWLYYAYSNAYTSWLYYSQNSYAYNAYTYANQGYSYTQTGYNYASSCAASA